MNQVELSIHDAYEEGKAAGYEIGYREGYRNGNSDGYNEAVAEAQDEPVISAQFVRACDVPPGTSEVYSGQKFVTGGEKPTDDTLLITIGNNTTLAPLAPLLRALRRRRQLPARRSLQPNYESPANSKPGCTRGDV